MWAVGRLSLLSRGLDFTRPKARRPPPVPPAPEAATVVADAGPATPIIGTKAQMPQRALEAEPEKVATAMAAPPPAPGLLQRVVSQVKSFFRSIFS